MTIYYFICEGKSEYAYLQLINRFFRDEGIEIMLKPYNANGGKVNNIKACAKIIRTQQNKVPNIYAFLDMDIYFREDENFFSLPESIIYLFNSWNFEDFFALHYDESTVERWHSDCCLSGHASCPEHSDKIVTRMRSKICPDYRKGTIPDGFIIDKDVLLNLFHNNGKHRRYLISDFAYFLECLLKPHMQETEEDN